MLLRKIWLLCERMDDSELLLIGIYINRNHFLPAADWISDSTYLIQKGCYLMLKKTVLCLVAAILMLVGFPALAESPAIPVVELEGDCLIDYISWNDKSTYYPATLTYADGDAVFTQEIEIKPQGTTSLYAPKKNFTIRFAEGVEMVPAWGAQEKYVLKADYIDPTHATNVVSAKLAAEMNRQYGVMVNTPNYGVIDGFPVWVKINGEDAGIFNWTIPKDAWLFGMDKNNPNHMVLACEGWSDASRLKTAEIDYEADWAFEVGEPTEESTAAFERMVAFVSTANDAEFVARFDQYLDLDACLNYLCYLNIAYASDNVAKNMLMVTYDGTIWAPALYDLDSLWGIGYDGTALAQTDGQWPAELLSNGNCLLYRVNALFGDQVRERYWQLREGILSKEHIMESFEAYADRIPQEYYEIDSALWNAEGERIRTIEKMGQLMDEYLPIVDAHFAAEADVQTQASAMEGPAVHYVWNANGVVQSSEAVEGLPVAMTLSYTLDGIEISAEELAGKSGRVQATLRVERKAEADHAYGVAALIHLEEVQCENLVVNGGTLRSQAQEYVCLGSAWLGGDNNTYEMQLTLDATAFDAAQYMVVASPLHVNGGGDGPLDALLATAGELTATINDGLALHESMTEWHTFLTNMKGSIHAAAASVETLIPAEEETEQESALGMMRSLLTEAEADADALLTELGYEPAAEAETAARVQLLSEVAADAERTEEEKQQASEQLTLLEKYQAVVKQLEQTSQVVAEVNESLTELTTSLPDLVGAYAYANDGLYAILYKISTLYQNLSNYYYATNGDGYDFAEVGDWYEVIIFSNDEGLVPPAAKDM